MSGVPAKFASALFVGIVAGAAWTALPQQAAQAADCLTEPKNETPQGQHWYFRIERGTGRHCWYTRGEDEKSARVDTPDPAPAEKVTPKRTEAATTRAISDAHAEIGPRTRVPGDAPAAAAPTVWPAPVAAPNAAPVPNSAPALSSRWPQTSGAGTPAGQPQANQPPANPPPETSLVAADAQATDANADAGTDAASQTLPPPMLAAAPVERNTGSIQKLLLVAIGALALAGLTGSAVYRLGRRRRRNHWLKERTAWNSAQNPNSPPWVDPQLGHADTLPDLDEVRAAAPDSGFSIAMAEGEPEDDRVEKIEDYLARLTKQLQAELEGSNSKRAEAYAPRRQATG
jgi:hypothetical protein